MNRTIAFVAAALLVATSAYADQGASQGKGVPHGQGQGQGQAQGQGQGQGQMHGPPDSRGPDDRDHRDFDEHRDEGKDNRGQVVSDCNHHANERKLKGGERKQFVEWCEDRGARYNYDERRWKGERTCYDKADRKGLSGDKRRKFLNKCFDEQMGNREYDPRGRDVLGKGDHR